MDKKRIVIQIIIVAIVSSALIAAWLIQYFEPIVTAKNELALISAQIVEKKAEQQSQINADLSKMLSDSKNRFEQKIKQILELNGELNEQLESLEEKLKNQARQYNQLHGKYSELAKRYTMNQNDMYELAEASRRLNETSDKLQKDILAVSKQRSETEARDIALKSIYTESFLIGLWENIGSKINGEKVYEEFLPKGEVRTHAGIDGESWIFSNKKWYFANGHLTIETNQDGKVIIETGTLEGDNEIVGTQSLLGGGTIPWRLRKVK